MAKIKETIEKPEIVSGYKIVNKSRMTGTYLSPKKGYQDIEAGKTLYVTYKPVSLTKNIKALSVKVPANKLEE